MENTTNDLTTEDSRMFFMFSATWGGALGTWQYKLAEAYEHAQSMDGFSDALEFCENNEEKYEDIDELIKEALNHAGWDIDFS